jgi:hypothetical protein
MFKKSRFSALLLIMSFILVFTARRAAIAAETDDFLGVWKVVRADGTFIESMFERKGDIEIKRQGQDGISIGGDIVKESTEDHTDGELCSFEAKDKVEIISAKPTVITAKVKNYWSFGVDYYEEVDVSTSESELKLTDKNTLTLTFLGLGDDNKGFLRYTFKRTGSGGNSAPAPAPAAPAPAPAPAVAGVFDPNESTDANVIKTYNFLSAAEKNTLGIQQRAANHLYSYKYYKQAFDAFVKLVGDYPGNYLSAYWAGVCAVKLKSGKEAEKWFDAALGINPDYRPAIEAKSKLGTGNK